MSRQCLTGDVWLQRGLIALMALWLATVVLAPLWQLARAATHDEVTVERVGSRAIMVGGRLYSVADGRLVIEWDDEYFETHTREIALTDGHAAIDEVRVRVAADRTTLWIRQVAHADTMRRIAPIEVVLDGRRCVIDDHELADDEQLHVIEAWIGPANFREYFGNRGLYASAANSVRIALLTTLIAVTLALVYAYGLTRTGMPLKPMFRLVALLPLFAPTMLFGLSLVYLFGRQGIVTLGFFGAVPWLAVDIDLYGPVGIVLAEVVFTFPPTLIILMIALAGTDARLYEASAALGAGPVRTFFSVTLPGIRYGLFSAVFVAFTLAFTDFGAPKVVGGNYNVLAVDIYKQVAGQQNFGMAATVSIVLLVPAVLAFVADRVLQRRQAAVVTSRSVPYVPRRRWAFDGVMFLICGAIALFIVLVVGMGGLASLIRQWPYDLRLGLWHYDFADVVTEAGGYRAYWTSVRMAAYTALFGTGLAFGGAYLVEKAKGLRWVRQFVHLLAIVPLALPGMVIGISYIFFFNRPELALPLIGLRVPNPFAPLYGTMALLVIANIVHFFTVAFLTATGALRQMDREFEQVGESMAVPFYRTFWRVTLPVSLPAVLEIAAYLFVSSMATVSALIFLRSPELMPASVAVVLMDEAGDTAPAAAMCMAIVGTNILVRLAIEALRGVIMRAQRWRRR